MNQRTGRMLLGTFTLIVLAGGCSLPTDTEPAQWQMNVEIPVVDKKYTARDLLPDNPVEGLTISFGNGSDSDTVCLVKTDTLSYSIEREVVTVDTNVMEQKLGSVTLQNTPPVDLQFNLLEGNGHDQFLGVPLPVAVTAAQSKDKAIDGLHSVTFDESSTPLVVTLTNNSQADLQNFQVTLLSGGTTIGTYANAALSANSSHTATITMGGKTVMNVITVSIGATVPAGSVVEEGDGVGVSFSLNGLVASEATLIDSLIQFKDVFEGQFGLADGIILDAVDMNDASLNCEVHNPVGMQIALHGIMNDAWKRPYAEKLKLETKEDLESVAKPDSTHFAGTIISDTVFRDGSDSVERFSILLNGIRVFPSWNSDSGKSVLSFKYSVAVVPDGRPVYFNKEDIMIFRLMPDRFPFIRVKGVLVDPLTESFTSEQGIGFGWESPIMDALRKRFRFASVEMGFSFVPGLPDRSTLDSLRLHVAMNSNVDPDDSIIVDRKVVRISADSLYSEQVELSEILNDWPDSIGFNSVMGVPAMTGIELFNSVDQFGNYNNTLTIGVNVDWRLKMPLAWRIEGDMVVELEKSTFKLDLEELEVVNRLREKSVILSLDVANNTNVYLTVFGFGSSQKYEKELDDYSLKLKDVKKYDPKDGSHVFSLFGTKGLSVPPREKRDTVTVHLDELGIQTLLSDDSCIVRWLLVMPEQGTDAFLAGDYLELNASADVNGIACTDSLLYWEDKE